MKTQKTIVDRIITKIKNSPILASLIVFGIVVIAFANFTTAIDDLFKFFFRHDSEQTATNTKENDNNISTVNISGEWVSDIVADFADEDVNCQRLFNFNHDKDVLFGRMRELCSDGFDWEFEIKEGAVKNKYISFFIQRRTGTGSPLEWNYYKQIYRGTVSDNVIELKILDERGYSARSIVASRGNLEKITK